MIDLEYLANQINQRQSFVNGLCLELTMIPGLEFTSCCVMRNRQGKFLHLAIRHFSLGSLIFDLPYTAHQSTIDVQFIPRIVSLVQDKIEQEIAKKINEKRNLVGKILRPQEFHGRGKQEKEAIS